jgi:hypothetical protein
MVGAAVATTALAAGVAVAAAPVPCTEIGGGKFDCTFYIGGDGRTGGAPVQAGSTTVGYLHRAQVNRFAS